MKNEIIQIAYITESKEVTTKEVKTIYNSKLYAITRTIDQTKPSYTVTHKRTGKACAYLSNLREAMFLCMELNYKFKFDDIAENLAFGKEYILNFMLHKPTFFYCAGERNYSEE